MGDADQVCQEFLEAWAPVLGVELADLYRADQARWSSAARRLRGRHSPERLRAAFAQMLEDDHRLPGHNAAEVRTRCRPADRAPQRPAEQAAGHHS